MDCKNISKKSLKSNTAALWLKFVLIRACPVRCRFGYLIGVHSWIIFRVFVPELVRHSFGDGGCLGGYPKFRSLCTILRNLSAQNVISTPMA
jgi:hypothetical protein